MERLTKEQIHGATLGQLTLWSRERGINATGTVEELQQRLIQFSELQEVPRPRRYGELTTTRVKGAGKAELQRWCRQYGLDDSGTVPELKNRLFVEMGTPSVRPSEYVPPPAGPSTGKILIDLLLLFIIVGVAGGVGWWVANALPGSIVGEEPLTTEPDEPTISFAEQSYLTRMGALANDYVNAVEGFSAAVADYVEGYFGVSYTLEVIDGYIVDMNEVYFSLLPLEPPCLAYSSMHDNTLTGVDLTATAMKSTYDGILFDDISYLSDAADYMEDANVYLQSALGELQGLGNTAPNCS